MSYTIEYPDLVAPVKGNRLGTDELPTEVVSQKVAIWIHAGTSPDPMRPRMGPFQMRFTFGDEVNPSLTPDQAKYVLRLIEHAAKTWKAAHEIIE